MKGQCKVVDVRRKGKNSYLQYLISLCYLKKEIKSATSEGEVKQNKETNKESEEQNEVKEMEDMQLASSLAINL